MRTLKTVLAVLAPLCLAPIALPAPLWAVPAATPDDGEDLPRGFAFEQVAGPIEQLTGFTFDPLDRLIYWQKKGVVWMQDDTGPNDLLLIDLTEEVGNWADHGLHGVALDPSYDENGYIYLYYVVDRHHLLHFGTPSYDPAQSDDFLDTAGRITRYTVTNPLGVQPMIDLGSRTILVGETPSTGVPVMANSHGIGPMHFGADGMLYFSAGDGRLSGTGSDTALADGIISAKEDVDSFRAQLLDSHNGKICRIDPATGDGVANNPFYDPTAPRAPRSRVWVLGLRNPYGWSFKPGTGDSHPIVGDPGVIFLGDVGSAKWEELNVAPTGGLNFGWPLYEAFLDDVWEGSKDTENLDAPNPLGGGSCPDHFLFQDLLIEDSLNPGSWPNPCQTSQQITSVPTFMHTRPVLAWAHAGLFPEPATTVPDYDGSGNAIEVGIEDPGSTVAGEAFDGNCAIGGVWYTGSTYPVEYQDTYFFADFGENLLFTMRFDANHQPIELNEFGDDVGAITRMVPGPDGEELYLLKYYGPGGSTIQKLTFGAEFPSVDAHAEPHFGAEPLRVEFHAETTDPAGLGLTYAWDFGDGTPTSPLNARPEPTHVYPSEDITASGTIISKLDELTPPTPMGLGHPNPEVMRDGFYAEEGAALAFAQFDTAHVDGTLQPDKGGEDYLGYTFASARRFVGVIYQEGLNTGFGGTFDSMTVQVRDAVSGTWSNVTGFTSEPAYPSDTDVAFETFQLLFDPVVGDGIRIHGVPGGLYDYVGAGELRVLATPEPATGLPQNFVATVTVTDDDDETDDDSVLISINNTPPTVSIASPANGLAYSATAPTPITLSSVTGDAEHAGLVACEWSISLVHDNHIHSEPLDPNCLSSSTLFPHGDLVGDVTYYSIELTATDPLGLSTTVTHYAVQANDCNLNGWDDIDDVLSGYSLDLNFDNIPDECQSDCDGSGLADVVEVITGTGIDANESNVLDACEPTMLDPAPGIPGQLNTFAITGAEPLSLVGLVAGFVNQATPLTVCGNLQMGIADPLFAGFIYPDANGDAAANLVLPLLPIGTTLYFQGIDVPVCEASNVVAFVY